LATVFTLTVRQLASSRRRWIMLLLVAFPLLAAVLFHTAETTTTAREFSDDITSQLIASAILPLVVLVLAVSAFGNEVEDRTLGYLVLKPLPRWRIVAPKLLGSILVGGIPVALCGFGAAVIILEGDPGGAAATGVGLLVGAAAYAAVFTWAGLVTRHALAFGLVYVFVWEASLAAYLEGIRFLSVRQYTLAIIDGLGNEALRTVDVKLGLAGGLVGAGIVIGGFGLLAVRRLRRMDVP
jgi:ABC-2 type transport system permease protein